MSTKQLEAAVENALDDLFAAREALESRQVRFDVEEAGREVLERIPDGWAKVDGQWRRIRPIELREGDEMGETETYYDLEVPS